MDLDRPGRSHRRARRPALEPLEGRRLPATTIFTVTTTADSGAGSLRQAILDAEAAAGNKAIDFAIPGAGVHAIAVASELPAVPINTVIDGWTQPGYAGSPLVEVDGLTAPRPSSASAQGIEGLRLSGYDGVRGLSIYGFAGDELLLNGVLDVVQGDDIGADAGGETVPGAGIGEVDRGGISLVGASYARIGGTTPGTPNIISGNHYGIFGSDAGNVTIQGNIIGMDRARSASLGNDLAGIDLIGVSDTNTIGGTAAGAGNLISGNGVGIILGNNDTPGPVSNTVEGNEFGVNHARIYFPNAAGDLRVGSDGRSNVIGGPSAAAGNTFAAPLSGGPATVDDGVGDQFTSNVRPSPSTLPGAVVVSGARVGTLAPGSSLEVVFTVTNHGPIATGPITFDVLVQPSAGINRSGSVSPGGGAYYIGPPVSGDPGFPVGGYLDIARLSPIGPNQSVQITVFYQVASVAVSPRITTTGSILIDGATPPGLDESVTIVS